MVVPIDTALVIESCSITDLHGLGIAKKKSTAQRNLHKTAVYFWLMTGDV